MSDLAADRIRILDVNIAGRRAARLAHASTYTFDYLVDDPAQPWASLLMPAREIHFEDGALFPPMDMNLPEGYLFHQIREMFPKQEITAMRLLGLIGDTGIGRLGFRVPGLEYAAPPPIISRSAVRSASNGEKLFQELTRAYLSTGMGISGLQPKLLLPDRTTVPIPTLIVKMGADRYPGISANEFLCLSAAAEAGIEVAPFELSDDGSLLILDRFDLTPDGQRLGFEDVAALMGLRVRDTLSDRKYHGSYQKVASLLKAINLGARDLERFFEQVAFTVMVRNGDGHLKNFGVLYSSENDARLAPMFDVVTTSIYKYARYDGGPDLEDRTMALKLFSGKHSSKAYPITQELMLFGREVCGVFKPEQVLGRIGDAMSNVLARFKGDDRIPPELLLKMEKAWEGGFVMASEARRVSAGKA
ncbi:MAG: type II toxin-antitoxin system HipA family toxin [Burkholderiaceae bacterium]|nr:type II toxin-antitoxin system HipA family toxin [Burkholderiaceae bacterium]